MKSITNHAKRVAYLLAGLFLLQSCIAYTKKPATPYVIEEALSENIPAKITTTNGIEYELNWIDYKNGNLYSITNTNRVDIEKENIVHLSILKPEPQIVTFEKAFNHKGLINVMVQKKMKRYSEYQFLKIIDKGNMVTGYSMSGNDTLTLNIPINQIEKLQIENKAKSAGRTYGLTFGLGLVAITTYGMIKMGEAMSDGWWSN